MNAAIGTARLRLDADTVGANDVRYQSIQDAKGDVVILLHVPGLLAQRAAGTRHGGIAAASLAAVLAQAVGAPCFVVGQDAPRVFALERC